MQKNYETSPFILFKNHFIVEELLSNIYTSENYKENTQEY